MCQHRDPLHEGLVSRHAQLQTRFRAVRTVGRGKIKYVSKYEKEGFFKG